MKKMTKWITLLMTGVLLFASLSACGETDDWNDDSGENGGGSSSSSFDGADYKDLNPTEFAAAMADASEMKITLTAVQAGSTVTQIWTRDGNAVKEEIGDSGTNYYDLKNHVLYAEDGGEWISVTSEATCNWDSILNTVIAYAAGSFDGSNYEDSANGTYALKSSAVESILGDYLASIATNAVGSLKVDGTTYTVKFGYDLSGSTTEYTYVIEFANQSVSLPD